MSSVSLSEDKKRQAKIGALVATAALATTFVGVNAAHADTVDTTTPVGGQVSQTNSTVGFESAASGTASEATSTGSTVTSGASDATSGAASSVASSAVASDTT